MILIILGRIAMSKQTGGILFIFCEGEMVKFTSAEEQDLEAGGKKW